MSTVKSEFAAALQLQAQGRLRAAEDAYRGLLARHGALPDVAHMLAVCLHSQGRSEEALEWFVSAESSRGGALLWSNHAAALLVLGRAAEAIQLCNRAIAESPEHPGAWLNLGLAHEAEGRTTEALGALSNALRWAPGLVPARYGRARCQLRQDDAEGAMETLRTIPEGQDAAADLLRAEALILAKALDAATALLRRLTADPGAARAAWHLLARVAVQQGRGDQALVAYRQILALDADDRQALLACAMLHINRAETDAGFELLQRWLAAHPDDQVVASNYLVACNYSNDYGPVRLLAESQRLQPHAAGAEAWPGSWSRRTRGKALRVGWVGTDFGAGPIAIFFADVLRALPGADPDIEHVLYALGAGAVQAVTPVAWAGAVKNLAHLDGPATVAALRADQLDVVVDLVGRAAGNRLAVFVARVAPVQIGWLDQFYPSGIATMDCLLTDGWLSPPGAEAGFTERLLRVPQGRVAYSPPPAPDVCLSGADSQCFVSFNRFAKLGEQVVEVWAEILRALPEWRLSLMAQGGDDQDLVALFKQRFARRGVAPERVQVVGGGSYADAMQAYQGGAVALDPFPFTGCSTSCDALWMGLPVVTWPHETMASRQSLALLQAIGKPEWVARDAVDYAAIAIRLAGDVAGRREWRRQARECLAPAICTAPRLAAELAVLLRQANEAK